MSALEDRLVESLLARYSAKGRNNQEILDSPLFQSLPLNEKVRLIEKYQGDLSKEPKFQWVNIGKGVGVGALSAGTIVLLNQVLRSAPINKSGIGVAMGLGAVMGGITNTSASLLNYNRDRTSSQLGNDPIKMLISRSLKRKAPMGQHLRALTGKLDSIPTTVGDAMSVNDIHFKSV